MSYLQVINISKRVLEIPTIQGVVALYPNSEIIGSVGDIDNNLLVELKIQGLIDFNANPYLNIQATGITYVGMQGVTGLGTTGPAGADGVTGIRGVDGATGVDGPPGVTGVIGLGITGPQGLAGAPGPYGFTGVAGVTGVQGNAGTQGITGVQGNTGPGGAGSLGPQGNTGVAGATGVGIQGIQGDTGVQGNAGTQGIQGIQGTQGVQGISIQGPQGIQGIQGNTGVAGSTGVQGIQGNTGIGATGVQGIQGNTGVAGSTGVQGIQGNTGIGATGVQGATGIQGSIVGLAPLASPSFTGTVAINSGTTFDTTGYGFLRPITFVLGAGVNVATGTDLTNWVLAARAGKFIKAFINAKTAPTGASLVVDIMKSSDNGSSWTSIWNITPANRPTLTSGSSAATVTSFDTTACAEGDLLRIDVITVGSVVPGQYVTVTLLALLGNN